METAAFDGGIIPDVEIDLSQLPIPDWNLRCPRCEYLLNGLPSHRCPECGTEFNISSVISTASRLRDPRLTGRETPFPDLGLACGQCGHPLTGALQHACPRCSEPFDAQALKPRGDWFTVEPWMLQGVPVELIGLILSEEYVPHMVQEHSTALATHYPSVSIASEFFFDFLHLMCARASASSEDHTKTPTASELKDFWQCPGCMEENPDGLDMCWSCQTPRP
ncbi:MAG: hypothetical protein JSU63_20635 [Phycisphaerales bacterium]|nr:MAG: hypothetical protein JSU63_20635 [Phycisphaerales bacterium]